MKTTKNINITENALGFAVNNNYKTIKHYNNINEAIIEGFKIAKTENKGLVIRTFFVNVIRTSEQIANKDKCTNWLTL